MSEFEFALDVQKEINSLCLPSCVTVMSVQMTTTSLFTDAFYLFLGHFVLDLWTTTCQTDHVTSSL